VLQRGRFSHVQISEKKFVTVCDEFVSFLAFHTMIHGLLDATQVISTTEINGAPFEVCAEADASHDRRSHLLTVTLQSFVRGLSQETLGQKLTPDWLPPSETVHEYIEPDEAHEMASDIFASWCHRVAMKVPQD
jgi:hypothetical protein